MRRRFASDAPATASEPARCLAQPRFHSARLALLILLPVLALFPFQRLTPVVRAATLPTGFRETTIVSNLASPTALALAPDGRMFIAEQDGKLRVVKDGQLLATPFLSVAVDSTGERGLLGVALDPDFSTNQYLYIYYTTNTNPKHNRLVRYTAAGDVAAAGSAQLILQLENLTSATNHNGGAIRFGPDGKLYLAVGENATASNAQTLGNKLGKMLRLNRDGSVPSDNPFVGTPGAEPEIWAYGLRNPFSFAFQPGSGLLFINDVGGGAWEEINEGQAGANYGWPTTEGPTTDPRFRGPRFAYQHGGGTDKGNAIVGAAFYNPATVQFPADYAGDFFYADYTNNWIRRLDLATNTSSLFASNVNSPIDVLVDPAGYLYYLARGGGPGGALVRVSYTVASTPSISTPPANQRVGLGQPATFTVVATGSAPLSYRWQRNNQDIPGATQASYTLATPTLADNGATFRCVVSNSAGSTTSDAATLTVINSQPPTATISLPAPGSRYRAGDTLVYAGVASDPEDGSLPPSAYSWQIVFHHDEHTHPFMQPTSGISGSVDIPRQGETSANVWYRVYLTVTDSAGVSSQVFRDVLPLTTTLTLQTQPPGLQLLLDGQPQTAPFSVTGVVGTLREIGAPSPQRRGGFNYVFANWSDGGAATHTITTTSSISSYTASFQSASPVEDVLFVNLPLIQKN